MAAQEKPNPYAGAEWATDQGGTVRRKRDGSFVFDEAPNHSGLAFGDPLPPGWGISPVNEAAREADKVGKFEGY